jgi:hypothetical protein
MGKLGEYFERLADDEDRTWVLVIDPDKTGKYAESLPRSYTEANERRRAGGRQP